MNTRHLQAASTGQCSRLSVMLGKGPGSSGTSGSGGASASGGARMPGVLHRCSRSLPLVTIRRQASPRLLAWRRL